MLHDVEIVTDGQDTDVCACGHVCFTADQTNHAVESPDMFKKALVTSLLKKDGRLQKLPADLEPARDLQDRWACLLGHIHETVAKLQQVLVTVQTHTANAQKLHFSGCWTTSTVQQATD